MKKGTYMNKLLFEEIPEQSSWYIKNSRLEKTVIITVACVFFALGLMCTFLGEHILSIPVYLIALWLSFEATKLFLQGKQILRVYDYKISYKKAFDRKIKEIHMQSSEYTVELRDSIPRTGYTTVLVFRNKSHEKVLRYRAVSIKPMHLQTPKPKWKAEELSEIKKYK